MNVPILMYHEVTPRPAPAFRKYALTPVAFAAQMRWLALAGYSPITLDDLLAGRGGQKKLPARPVVITFDDGFQDCAEYAAPILGVRGFTATFFLVAGLMGRGSEWLRATRGIELALMDWSSARRLEAAGFQCGAHSLSHPHLADLDPATCRTELWESRQRLEHELGHGVRHLAYPYGSYNDVVRATAAECGYQTACSVRIGLSTADDDPFALHRVPISGLESFVDFVFRLRTGLTMRETWQASGPALKRRLGPGGAPAAPASSSR
jgi:peptidoglycan/xylan/chitin deacetylase (PgdA/CDA1 family)